MTDQLTHSDDVVVVGQDDADAMHEQNGESPGLDDGGSSRRRWMLIGVGVGAIAVVAGLVLLSESDTATEAAETSAPNTAEVVVTDLIEQESFEATLGSVEDDPIQTQRAGTITEAAEAGSTVSQGELLFAIDGEPVVLLEGDLPAYRDIAIGEETVTVTGKLNGTVTSTVEVGTVLTQGDVIYTVDGEPVVILYGEQPAYRRLFDARTNLTGTDVLKLEEALVALGYDPDATVTVDEEFTNTTEQMVERWQEDIGADDDGSVDFGEVIFLPGPAQVVDVLVSPGDQATSPIMVVSTGDAATGYDVAQLESALLALGFDAEGELITDGIYDDATNSAVIEFQVATGMEPDGVVNLGEVVFQPGAVRVTDVLAGEATGVNPGSPILGISASEKVVRLDLPAANQGLVAPGDGVIVELPDFSEVPATVISVAQTATRTQDGGATFEVLIQLDDPSVAGQLDEAPVDVLVLSDSVEDVVAIPVSALVALLEGGYAVEVVNGSGLTRLVPVGVGFFADGMVEVTSGSIQPGEQVVVP